MVAPQGNSRRRTLKRSRAVSYVPTHRRTKHVSAFSRIRIGIVVRRRINCVVGARPRRCPLITIACSSHVKASTAIPFRTSTRNSSIGFSSRRPVFVSFCLDISMFFRVFDRRQTENYLSSCTCMTLFLICHMFLRGILCLPVSVIASPLLASSILPFLLRIFRGPFCKHDRCSFVALAISISILSLPFQFNSLPHQTIVFSSPKSCFLYPLIQFRTISRYHRCTFFLKPYFVPAFDTT